MTGLKNEVIRTQENPIGSILFNNGNENSCMAALRKSSGRNDKIRPPKIIAVVFEAL